jgi:transketolase
LEVLSPADRFEMQASMNYAAVARRPVYLRMGKADRGDVHSAPLASFQPGALLKVCDGRRDQPGLIATGSMVSTAMTVAEVFDLNVWSAPMLKPLDADHVCTASLESNGIVTLEEHSVMGGLGSAVSEILSEKNPTKVIRIGVQDRFSLHCGSYDYLLEEHKLTIKHVLQSIASLSESLSA